jgi:Tripartite tricarboxylate transporter family receptor
VDEAGLPSFYASLWHGLWVPKLTPPTIITKLNAAVVDALADPGVRARLADLGQEIFPRDQQTPEALRAFQKAEVEKWWPIIKEAGISKITRSVALCVHLQSRSMILLVSTSALGQSGSPVQRSFVCFRHEPPPAPSGHLPKSDGVPGSGVPPRSSARWLLILRLNLPDDRPPQLFFAAHEFARLLWRQVARVRAEHLKSLLNLRVGQDRA